jgi:hypothetical protein
MAVIINSNVGAFLAVKIGATILIALTYVFAKNVLMQIPNKSGKVFNYSFKFLSLSYAGIIGFLALAVANNILILIR